MKRDSLFTGYVPTAAERLERQLSIIALLHLLILLALCGGFGLLAWFLMGGKAC